MGEFAPGLKTIDDATYLRRRILLAFEKAETEPDPGERRRLLNFIIVGGGPTGVEMAGAIAELAKRALASDFRAIDPREARVVLIEAAPRLLTPFNSSLSEAAKNSLEKLGVEVRLAKSVTAADCGGVSLGDERLEARTIMWAAGVVASPAGQWLGAKTDRAGRVVVEPDLSIPAIQMCSLSAMRRARLAPTASPYPVWRPWRNSKAPTWPRSSKRGPKVKLGLCRSSAIVTSARLPPSAESAPLCRLGTSSSTAFWHGCCGASPTSIF